MDAEVVFQVKNFKHEGVPWLFCGLVWKYLVRPNVRELGHAKSLNLLEARAR